MKYRNLLHKNRQLTYAALPFTLFVAVTSASNTYGQTQGVTGFNHHGWNSDDTRNAAGIHIKNPTTNAPLAGATMDALGVSAQIDWQDFYGSRGNLGGVSLDSTASASGKTTLSAINTGAGFAAAGSAFSSGIQASYSWKNTDTAAAGIAFKIGIQSTEWATSQIGYTPTRSGEAAWDLILVFDPADPGNLPGNTTTNGAIVSSTINNTTGLFYLFDQSGNSHFTPPGFTGKTLAAWQADATWGPRLFGAGAKITSTQFGLGSGNPGASGVLDQASVSYMNGGKRIDFVDAARYTGPGSDFATAANWGGTTPSVSQNLVIDTNAAIHVASGEVARSMGVLAGTTNLTLDAGASLTLTKAQNGSLSADTASTLNVSGLGNIEAATLEGGGSINIASTVVLNGGALSHPIRDGSPAATSRYGMVVNAGGTTSLLSGAVVSVSENTKNVGVRVGEGLGTSVLNVQAGASLTIGNNTSFASNGLNSNGFFVVGDFGSTGIVNQTGGSVKLTDGSFNLGNQGGTGTYNLSAGALTIEGGLSSLGRNTGSRASGTGTINLSGTGVLKVQSSINNGNATLVLADRDASSSAALDGSGIVNQSGGTFRVAANSNIFLGGYGSSQYNLTGGVLEVGGNSLNGIYGGGTGNYAFNLGGGTIKVTNSNLNSSVNASLTTATSSTLDSNGFNAKLGVITGAGTLIKTGIGDADLAATSNFGALVISQGSVSSVGNLSIGKVSLATATSLSGLGALTVNTEITGTGTIGIATTVNGVLAAGSSPGIIFASNDVAITNTGTLAFDFQGNAVGIAGSDYDQVTLTTAVADFSLASGSLFSILFTGSTDLTNAFWDLDQSWVVVNNTAGCTVTDAGATIITNYAGSFVGEGGFSLNTSSGNLNLAWTAVPEPSMLVFSAVALCGLGLRRRRTV